MSFCRSDGRCEICDPPTRQNPDEELNEGLPWRMGDPKHWLQDDE